MKISVVSDLHGCLPVIPECDVLVLAGDYSPYPQSELSWLQRVFSPWIEDLSQRMQIVGVAGNHDFSFERHPNLIPKLNWIYLENSKCTIEGLNFYGTPWQPTFFNWAFNTSEQNLNLIYSRIPEDTDVLITHCPPKTFLDSTQQAESVGSKSLADHVQRVSPRLHVFGHIHHSYGNLHFNGTTFVNASLCDELYKPTNKVQVFELKGNHVSQSFGTSR